MDNTLFDPIDPQWQDPHALRLLQRSIAPYITKFDNMDFLEWSRKNNYPISECWHPLEEAHRAAVPGPTGPRFRDGDERRRRRDPPPSPPAHGASLRSTPRS